MEMAWDASASVGLAVIDDDHKALVYLQSCVAKASADEAREVLVRVLADLEPYVSFHFLREEKMLAACGYPQLVAHVGSHRAFAQTCARFRAELESGRDAAMLAAELASFLAGWLHRHILIEDMAYKSYVANSETARAAAAAFGPGLMARLVEAAASPIPLGARPRRVP